MYRENDIKSTVMGGNVVGVDYSVYGENHDEVFIDGVWFGGTLLDAGWLSGSVISELTGKVEDRMAQQREERAA